MKKFLIFAMIIVSLFVFVACDDPKTQPVLDDDSFKDIIVEDIIVEDIIIEETSACSHDNYSWSYVKTETCTEDGYREATCNNCGVIVLSESYEKHGHVYSWKTSVEPTCYENGERVEYCLMCGHKSGNTTEIEQLSHNDYISYLHHAGHDEYYIINHYCTHCDQTYLREKIYIDDCVF